MKLKTTEELKWFKGDLPLSNFHFSVHLKWIAADPGDSFSPAKAFSPALGVWWEYDLDSNGRFCLFLNGMRVGALDYGYPSIPQSLAERCEDIMHKDISAYLHMLEVVQNSKELS